MSVCGVYFQFVTSKKLKCIQPAMGREGESNRRNGRIERWPGEQTVRENQREKGICIDSHCVCMSLVIAEHSFLARSIYSSLSPLAVCRPHEHFGHLLCCTIFHNINQILIYFLRSGAQSMRRLVVPLLPLLQIFSVPFFRTPAFVLIKLSQFTLSIITYSK